MDHSQAITACAFLHKDGLLFAPRRAATKKFLPDKFELPGGHIEYGEDIVEGLKRELEEEFGIQVKTGYPFFAFTYMNEVKQTHSVEIVYFVQLKNPEQKISLNPDDHSEYKWLNETQAKKLWPKADQEFEAVLRGFFLLKNKSAS